MAQKPDGKPAGTERVTFTRPAAQRIARVVRTVESGDRAQSALTFSKLAQVGQRKAIRAATFSGSWPTGSTQVVTFQSSGLTATATNISWPLGTVTYTNEPCILGLDRSTWYLLVPRLETATATIVTGVQTRTYPSGTEIQNIASGLTTTTAVSGISISAILNTSDCTIAIGQTLTTTAIGSVTATADVRVVTQTATAVFVTATASRTYLRIRGTV